MLVRHITMDESYLHIPVKLDGRRRNMQIWCGKALLHEFYLAITDEEDCHYFFLNMENFHGSTLTILLPDSTELTQQALLNIRTGGDATPANPLYPELYREALRPQYHFSSRRGWLNDPNGLVCVDGVYHMYYQHNPLGVPHGSVNISWGHATSTDLVHWHEKPDAILPWRRDWMIASGSALVDHENAAGCGENAIIAAFTALATYDDRTGGYFPSGGQFMAASTDGGDTFHLFSTQASVPTENGQGWRDPRIFRYEDHYVMAVYETQGEHNCVSFYVSDDLRRWTKTSANPDLYECPDLFPLTAEDGEIKWVLYGADGMARIGEFDGYAFHEMGISHPLDYGDATYAGQTWNNHPQGRRIHISWVRGMGGKGEDLGYEGMPFSQCMTIPCEITLSHAGGHYRALRNPVRETESLRLSAPQTWQRDIAGPAKIEIARQSDSLFLLSGVTGTLELKVGKHVIRFNSGSRMLSFENGHSCKLSGDTIRLQLLADTTTMELFFGDGIACTYAMPPEEIGLVLCGQARVSCEQWQLRSIWPAGADADTPR